ncbi:putative lipoprotein [Synechococcus sp. PROS-U-1]|nr:putative lipoprotein [Synechococcus sp. PROS-U-1]
MTWRIVSTVASLFSASCSAPQWRCAARRYAPSNDLAPLFQGMSQISEISPRTSPRFI